MSTLTAHEAKTHFGALLNRVESGEEIVITRRGNPVARISPEVAVDLAARKKFMEEVIASREAMRKRMEDAGEPPLSMAEIVREGRDH